jgi:hypothetical protein
VSLLIQVMSMLSRIQFALAACLFQAMMALADTIYVAPGVTDTLSDESQAYQIGVWSFVIFVTAAIMAVYGTASTDYSNDTLITVDIEKTHDEEE